MWTPTRWRHYRGGRTVTVDWTPLTIAIVALLGTVYTAWRSSGKKDRATLHVERADHVVDIQKSELDRLAVELEKSRIREDQQEQQIQELSKRVAKLELAVIRLGGDPSLL